MIVGHQNDVPFQRAKSPKVSQRFGKCRDARNRSEASLTILLVNFCDNHLENLRCHDPTCKVRPIEEDFHRLMGECQDV